MKCTRKQGMSSAATGLAGLLALFSQSVSSGPTVDFKPVDDVYQADTPVRESFEDVPVQASDLIPRLPANRGEIVMNRYVQRSQFDGRGGILDAYS